MLSAADPQRQLRFARAVTPAGTPADGVVQAGRFTCLGAVMPPGRTTIADLLPDWPRNLARLRAALSGQRAAGQDPGASWPVSSTRLLPPVTPRQIFQVALNYADHAAEMDLPIPRQPFVFAGLPSAICGPGDDIVLPSAGNHDWELELAVVIRRRARHVGRAEAAGCVAGYTIANDLTTRDRLRRAGPGRTDYLAAKNAPTFLPVGPFLVPADEVDVAGLPLILSVNGQVMQRGSTADMVFDVPGLIAALSDQVELLPGDLLLTGTPAGTGQARGRFLQPGDVIEATIGDLGQQRNRCVAEQVPDSRPVPRPAGAVTPGTQRAEHT
ncbi:MAG TPA: fumarylacetoacetate hydrolase family protein [Streptosporangiaceae bacterium]|nr:fumarylacetoacetate hydrolase family protein [Streptosporangiaceae bacterium]